MSLFSRAALPAVLSILAQAAFAEGIQVTDAYARANSPTAPNGAAFMIIMNDTDADDRLIAARSDVAGMVELHTHIMDAATGVARMRAVEDGFPIAAGETLLLQRGGHHVMMMRLNTPFTEGTILPITLVFEKAGEVAIEVPVDLNRMP